ncbi:hypothetical protein Q0812_00550 [Brevundimonas sp. 2R-24]|uniref:Lipoprotein n=1 Tax=Peiella sedimenti TaxID=3061083 RepID=A0ABT8SIV8_9CAUL|nr:hypothetical protein [Caulobacteraceae bacterium XZ-24]
MTRSLTILALAGAMALPMTACGRQGDLERPEPIGNPPRRDMEPAARTTKSPNLPEQATDARPARQAPIDGARNPFDD